ncbi:MAG: hypothetical protein F2754_05995 [Actinobacteria bacterium]|uniref:Unannotated protein n=1 Tax=freshwater metagenome TaxID=449393 RepID=A0A6J7A7L1_9ZZZZ|nr:hypothetical protein [Actinomycetota bacterium]MSW91180.1 hypothetical protein [Actinomycetota bacterium]MSX86921.1 hypothetical protein [Actinomycetota bacterium]MSY72729.1 hypothetical protein [Actinomycetota bacterium]
MTLTRAVVQLCRVHADPATDPRARDNGTPAAEGRGSLGTVCALVLMLVAGFIGATELHDNSFLTHLATGRWIARGNFTRMWLGASDPYLWTSGSRTWVVQSWLASSAYHGAERVGGVAGIRLLVAATCMALTACLWRLSAPARTLVPRVVAVGFALAIGGSLWNERPLMFGLLFLALALLAADGGMRTVWLAPIGWLWVNTHGSFPLGFVALLTIAIGARLDGHPVGRELRALRDLAAGCVLGGIVSPVGPVLLTFPVSLLRRQEALSHIQEWKPTDFSMNWARCFLLLVALCIVALVRRPSYRSALPLAVFFVAASIAARNVAVASVVLVPILARGFGDLGSITDIRSRGTRLASASLAALLPVLVISTAVSGDFRFDAYPVSSVDFLDSHQLLDGSVRVVEQDFAGNYLELRYGGQVPVFIDDRYDLHDRGLIADYVKLADGVTGWDEVLDRLGADVLLWRADEQLVPLLASSNAWGLAFDSASHAREAAAATGDADGGAEVVSYVVYCRPTVAKCFDGAHGP